MQRQNPFTHDTVPKRWHRFAKPRAKKKEKKFLEMKEKNIKMEKDFEEITQNVV